MKIKSFFMEFKEFISRGNVLDLAVGVIIGGAFKGVVDSLTKNIIQPLIDCIGGADVQGEIVLVEGVAIKYGAFISSVINFLIMAFVVFCIVKFFNKMKEIADKEMNIVHEETTKTCPYCKSKIAIDATRCPHCTSILDDNNK